MLNTQQDELEGGGGGNTSATCLVLRQGVLVEHGDVDHLGQLRTELDLHKDNTGITAHLLWLRLLLRARELLNVTHEPGTG